MTGLEKILKHIEEEASFDADTIISKAQEKANEITAAAKAEGEKQSSEILEKSKQDVSAYLSRAESAAMLEEKKLILNAKQEIICNIIDKAKKQLLDLPDKDYFEVIVKMVQNNALNMPGEIIFCESDRQRLPKQFDTILRTALTEKNEAVLTVSGQSRELDGGFILVYGDIEENCSFGALFSAASETLQDKISALLFD